eukprot:COSAG01_NODE_14585_length_1435_cov_4.131737_1_plen_68_part_00
MPLVQFPLLPAEAKLRMDSEPLLLALGKLDVPKLAQRLLEFALEFKNSDAGCSIRLPNDMQLKRGGL